MKKHFSQLQMIENNHDITSNTDDLFLYHLEQALLLALRERGRINMIQYRRAEHQLLQQRRVRTRKLLQGKE